MDCILSVCLYCIQTKFLRAGIVLDSELERAYNKAPCRILLASILKSRDRVTVLKQKISANFDF